MFIQTEATPNPATVKFIPGGAVMDSGTADFRDAPTARAASPLAARLFDVSGVAGVFLGADFISVTKDDHTDWSALKAPVLAAIMEHVISGQPTLSARKMAAHVSAPDDSPVVIQIKELIDTRVRPAVAADGGDIVFHDYADGVVTLEMRGACAGCPSSTATLKSGIENMLKHFVPEIREVRAA